MGELLPDYQLALAYSGAKSRAGLTAIFEIDSHFARLVYSAREPMLAQIKLAWWREQGFGARRADTELAGAYASIAASGDEAAAGLVNLVDAWSSVAGDTGGEAATSHRGEVLFALALHLSGRASAENELAIGRAWGLAEVGKAIASSDLLNSARTAFEVPECLGLRKLPRPLATLAALAKADACHGLARMSRPGSPSRITRALLFNIAIF
jgi:15-cis-phytoene synthase